jgi:N-acyl amino acid synthase of PEP-CTERM/exosortase system
MNESSLSMHFANYFRIVFAHTPERLEDVYRVRYDVYCREFHYEHEEKYPNQLEQDIYDAFSLHCLVVHRASNLPAGCVRLIKVPRNNLDVTLPLEVVCGDSLRRSPSYPKQSSRTNLCEISRLAVHTAFRRRSGESESPLGSGPALLNAETSALERRTFPLISIALIAASTAFMVLSERSHLFVMIEKWLSRLLRRLGLQFNQIGEFIDYHGPRAPYHLTAEQMLQGMRGELKEIYDMVHQSLADEIAKSGLDPAQ